MNALDDIRLIERMRSGDPDAFNLLFERYKRPLYSYIIKMTGNRTEADDLFQETFLRVVKNIRRYDHKGRFLSWALTIATNLMRDGARRKKRGYDVSLNAPAGDDTTLTVEETVPSGTATPEDAYARAALARDIEAAVADLPEEQKRVFVLREKTGMTFREIAELLECPLNTVLGRMRYAMLNLRKRLGQYEEEIHAMQ